MDEATFEADGGFHSQVTDADLDNTMVAVPAPQVLALFALGIVLLGLGVATRHRHGSTST